MLGSDYKTCYKWPDWHRAKIIELLLKILTKPKYTSMKQTVKIGQKNWIRKAWHLISTWYFLSISSFNSLDKNKSFLVICYNRTNHIETTSPIRHLGIRGEALWIEPLQPLSLPSNKGRSPSNGELSDFSFYIDSQKSAHRKFKK